MEPGAVMVAGLVTRRQNGHIALAGPVVNLHLFIIGIPLGGLILGLTGADVAGAIQFKIEGEVYLDDEFIVRAGYSANASIVTDIKENVLAINEALIQYDNKSKKPFVEVQIADQKFERRDIEIGVSDGVYAEILSGVTEKDNIKVWNKTEPLKRNTDAGEDAIID